MATIPSKQLHRVGTTEQLQDNLSNREIGYSTTDNTGYIKLDGVLRPLGSSMIPIPSAKSILAGNPDGTCTWDSRGLGFAPYDDQTQLWMSFNDVGIYATASRNDSEGHFISSSQFKAPEALPVYGALCIETDSDSQFKSVKIRKGNSNPLDSDSYITIGGLLPVSSPSIKSGDVLRVTNVYNGVPSISWEHSSIYKAYYGETTIEDLETATENGSIIVLSNVNVDTGVYVDMFLSSRTITSQGSAQYTFASMVSITSDNECVCYFATLSGTNWNIHQKTIGTSNE